MKKKAYTPERVVKPLRGVDAALAAGKTVEEACRELGGTADSHHRRRNQYGGMPTDEVKRLKELEKEDERLKRVVAELTVDKLTLKAAVRGN